MTIRTKLKLGLALILVMFVGSTWLAVTQTASVSAELHELIDVTVPALGTSSRMALTLDRLRISAAFHVLEQDQDKIDAQRREIEWLQSLMYALLAEARTTMTDPARQATLAAFAVDFNDYVKSYEQWRRLSEENRTQDAFALLRTSDQLHDRLMQRLAEIDTATRAIARINSEHGEQALDRERTSAIASAVEVTVVFLILVVFTGRTILRPMNRLIESIAHLEHGEFSHDIPYTRRRDEIGDIAKALEQFRTTAIEKARLQEQEAEDLVFARRMHMASVPQHFPAFPERTDFDIHGRLAPHRAVGGDFFDFYLLDPTHLAFSIGDAAGKGIASAVLVGSARAVLKSARNRGADAMACVGETNQLIAHDNESMMFVTLFYGVLDLETGELTYANAGHLPPFILDGAGNAQPLQAEFEVPLGVIEDFEYQAQRYRLRPGETIVLYTDGITEAENRTRQQYGEERLQRTLARLGDASCEKILSDLVDTVHAFADGEPQNDDIAVLVLRYNGSPGGPPGGPSGEPPLGAPDAAA